MHPQGVFGPVSAYPFMLFLSYMQILPMTLVEPFYWWLIKAPKNIFTILGRVLAFVNSEIAFTLNIRLIFTPLFGDYTIVGRLLGFIIRVVQIIFGAVLIIFLLIITFVSPLVWWALPFALYYYVTAWLFPILITAYGLRIFLQRDVPPKRVSKSSAGETLCFRPKALYYAKLLAKKNTKVLPQLVNEPKIQTLLRRAELLNNDFLHELSYETNLDTHHLVEDAFEYAARQKARYVEIEHVFVSALKHIVDSERLLASYDSSLETCEGVAAWVVEEREKLARVFFWQMDYRMPPIGGIGKGMTGRITPILDSVSEDFTGKAQKGQLGEIIGREKEIEEIANLLGGSKVNVLVIGEPGSGKTAIVRGMANAIIVGTKYKTLKNKRVVSLETGLLMSGAKTSGDVAEKLTKLMKEVEASKDVILFIDEIHNLVSGVGNDEVDVSSIFSILEPYMSSGDTQFIAATSIQNYRKHIEPNGAFSRLFETVKIEPASDEETLEILKFFAPRLECEHGVLVTFKALEKIVELSKKLIHERVFPDKALDILSRCIVSVKESAKYIDSKVVAAQISKLTQIPVETVTQEESQKLLNIEAEMKKYVIGQDEAIAQLGKALKRARAGIRNETKPIASFLFVGTTGVGKTETAKTLSRIYFGDVKAMIRLDMSEYQQVDSINKLIGTPDGATSGTLTESVRSKPFILILLDEIEKAYPTVLHTFLQVLDDARLTDASGRTVDFTNTIIIATSNVGTRSIQKIAQEEGSFSEISKAAMTDVRDHFAPEFLNRFNGVIVFRPLTKDNVLKITELMLQRVTHMADEQGVKVSFKPELIAELAKRGYDPEWGARPLARVIEENVETYLAVKLLAQEIQKGDTIELGLEVFEEA